MDFRPRKLISALRDGRALRSLGQQGEPNGQQGEPKKGPAEPVSTSEPVVDLVLGSGVFDTEWYAAQAGTEFSEPAEAVRHYLAHGRRSGWSPHPLFFPAHFRPLRWARDSTDPLVTYLRGTGNAWRSATSPLFDPARLDSPRDADRSPLAAFLADDGSRAPLPLAPEAVWLRDGVTLSDVREVLRSEQRDPEDSPTGSWRDRVAEATVPGLVSIVVVDCDATTDVVAALRTADQAVRRGDGGQAQPVEVVLLAPGERRQAVVGRALARLARCEVRFVSVSHDAGVSSAVDEAVHGARGEYTVLTSARQAFRDGTLRDWLVALEESSAAVVHPVVLDDDLLVRDAGVAYPPHGKDPVPFLKGVHPDSVSWSRRWFPVPGAPAPLVARTDSVRAVQQSAGPQAPSRPSALWADIDLSQRLAAHEGRPVVVVRDLVATCAAGGVFDDTADPDQDLAAFRAAWGRVPSGSTELFEEFDLAPVFVGLAALTVPDRPKSWTRALWLSARERSAVLEAPPTLRWAIKTAMPASDRARQWGDFHFAGSLAAALRELGQQVVVDYGPNDGRETSYRDDVVLMLRGLRPARLPADATSVVWVISHPEDVTARELAGYDLRYAASLTWARDTSSRWELPVRSLLQCTDSSRFYIDDDPVEDVVGKAVLVGNSRGKPRPVAVEAARSGTPFVVYGSSWERFLPSEVIAGSYVPNEIVRRYYRSAAWALNDTWPDMRDLGFVSNRVFDILASGGRLLTDDVQGLDEIVRPVLSGRGLARFTTPEELHAVLAEGSESWYDEVTLRALSDHVRTEHDFRARAAVLVEDVLAQRVHPRP
ncbi:hypothetical protein GCM10027063_04830 [Promicromonospora xylanilytica]